MSRLLPVQDLHRVTPRCCATCVHLQGAVTSADDPRDEDSLNWQSCQCPGGPQYNVDADPDAPWHQVCARYESYGGKR